MSIGALGRLFDEWQEGQRYRPSKRKIADNMGISPSSLDQWRTGTQPNPGHLSALAREMHYPYRKLLDAMLEDQGYLPQPTAADRRTKVGAAKGAAKARARRTKDTETTQRPDAEDSGTSGRTA